MKKRIFILLLLIISIDVSAQSESEYVDRNRDHLFTMKNVRLTGLLFDVGYLNLPIGNVTTHGGTINISPVLNNHFATGLAMEFVSTKELAMPTPIQVINPSYRYMFIGWNNEYLIVPERLINASIQLKTGLGKSYFYDKAEHTYVNTGNSVTTAPREINSDGFFVLQPGVNLFANITSFLSLGVGGNYRFAWGVDDAGSERDFNNYSWTATLRFVIGSEDLEAGE